jgi:hypothetical protein
MVDLKAAISSAMASAGVLQPRVFLGRLFIRFAMSLSHVWLEAEDLHGKAICLYFSGALITTRKRQNFARHKTARLRR